MITPGKIIILNGVPRSGKSSIADIIVETFPGEWINLGVDQMAHEIPNEFRPGIGLRPGSERPDLEPVVRQLYSDLHQSIADSSRCGINVVTDVGYHSDYAVPFDPYQEGQRILAGLPVIFVGVRCPIETIMARRNAGGQGYAKGTEEDPIPAPVQRWQDSVHKDRTYDLEVDTSIMSPEECARLILEALPVQNCFSHQP